MHSFSVKLPVLFYFSQLLVVFGFSWRLRYPLQKWLFLIRLMVPSVPFHDKVSMLSMYYLFGLGSLSLQILILGHLSLGILHYSSIYI
jgi:hypothetical protein